MAMIPTTTGTVGRFYFFLLHHVTCYPLLAQRKAAFFRLVSPNIVQLVSSSCFRFRCSVLPTYLHLIPYCILWPNSSLCFSAVFFLLISSSSDPSYCQNGDWRSISMNVDWYRPVAVPVKLFRLIVVSPRLPPFGFLPKLVLNSNWASWIRI